MAMTEDHKTRLRKNQVALVNFLQVQNPAFLMSLKLHDIFTDDMVEKVQAKPTRKDQVREVLELIVRRGGRAFNRLILAIKEIPQNEIIDKLILVTDDICDQNSIDAILQLVDDCPFESDVAVIPTFVSDISKRAALKDMYSMAGPGDDSDKLSNRRATVLKYGLASNVLNADSKMVQALFKQMHFTTEEYECAEGELAAFLEEEKKRVKEGDAYIFFLLHSGSVDYGMSTDAITSHFNSDTCGALKGKPALFFIQSLTCSRFTAAQSGDGKTANIQSSNKDSDDAMQTVVENDSLEDGNSTKLPAGHRSDQLIVNFPSSPPSKEMKPGDNKSEQSCSAFIACFAHSFATHAHSANINDLLAQVNAVWKVWQKRRSKKGSGDQGDVQGPSDLHKISRLRFSFFFYPSPCPPK